MCHDVPDERQLLPHASCKASRGLPDSLARRAFFLCYVHSNVVQGVIGSLGLTLAYSGCCKTLLGASALEPRILHLPRIVILVSVLCGRHRLLAARAAQEAAHCKSAVGLVWGDVMFKGRLFNMQGLVSEEMSSLSSTIKGETVNATCLGGRLFPVTCSHPYYTVKIWFSCILCLRTLCQRTRVRECTRALRVHCLHRMPSAAAVAVVSGQSCMRRGRAIGSVDDRTMSDVDSTRCYTAT